MPTTIRMSSGRRITPTPVATDRGPRVRLPITNSQGTPLPTVSDGLSADEAIAFALALVDAAIEAKAQHAMLTGVAR